MRTVVLLIVTSLLLPFSLLAGPKPAKPRVRSEMLVTTEWLIKHLDSPSVVVLHVSHDAADYRAGHIPGARFLGMNDMVVVRNGVPNELPPVEQLKALFERLGVGDKTRVILYGDMGGLHAARAYFTLDYLGHGQAALLDGGLEKWRAEKRPITTEVPTVKPARLTPKPRPEVVLDVAAVQKLLPKLGGRASPKVALIDARPPEQYSGQQAGEDVPRPGHIPGSENLFWMQTLKSKDEPVLKSAAACRPTRPRMNWAAGDRGGSLSCD
jgi:thiosulfate/3-mercaptopyruvate sulfurtransferase